MTAQGEALGIGRDRESIALKGNAVKDLSGDGRQVLFEPLFMSLRGVS